MKINHVGYLVGNIERAILSFEALGYSKKSDIVEDPLRKIKICFLEQEGYCIELVSPTEEESVVYKTYKKMKDTPYHICYEVANIEESIAILKTQGYTQIQPIQEAVAFGGRRVVFLYNKYIGLIELVEV